MQHEWEEQEKKKQEAQHGWDARNERLRLLYKKNQ